MSETKSVRIEPRIVAGYAVLAVVTALAAWAQYAALDAAARESATRLFVGGAWLPLLYGLMLPFVGRVTWETSEEATVRPQLVRAVLVGLFGLAVIALAVSIQHPEGSPQRTIAAVATDPPSRAAFLALVAEYAVAYALGRLAAVGWRRLRGEGRA